METFVVRVWVPSEAEAGTGRSLTGLHGVVEHVISKRGRPFRGEDDLVAFIRDCLPSIGAPPTQPGTDVRDASSVRGIPGAGPDQPPAPAPPRAPDPWEPPLTP